MFVIKKNQIIVCCLAVLVVTAGYLNFSYGKKDIDVSRETVGEIHLVEENGDFFEAARSEREISRQMARETLNGIIDNSESEAVSKQMAEEEVIKTAKLSQQEQLCESLIKAKGYEDAVVFVNGDKASVLVKSQTLSPEEATRISEIVTEQTGVPAAGIKITQTE